MFIWQLGPVMEAEGSVEAISKKALVSGIDALLIKIAEGAFAYRNTEGEMGTALAELREECRQCGIQVWGWHVPRCTTAEAAPDEAAIVGELARRFALDGLIMNAEPGEKFFQGDVAAAEAYGRAMRNVADALGKPMGICSLALPSSHSSWPERLAGIAAHADINLPQAYYGTALSISDFLAETEAANAGLGCPLMPVGVAWIGADGGCISAEDCARRALDFIDLCGQRGYPGHAFWHWAAAPQMFWDALKTTTA